MDFKNILINIILSSGIMFFVIYIFYFYIVTNIEANLFKSLLSMKLLTQFNNNKPIQMDKTKINAHNAKIIKKAQKIFFSAGAVLCVLGLVLIFVLGKSYYEVLIHNGVIIGATISAELLFLFLYTRKYILFDNFTIISYAINTINDDLQSNYAANKDFCDFSRPQQNSNTKVKPDLLKSTH